MKNQKFSFVALIALLLTVSVFSLSTASSLSSTPPNPEILIDECVGECGTVASASATANASGTHFFSASGNLCSSHAAYTIVKVNGNTVYQGYATPGTQQSFYASNNDQITLYSYLVDGQSNVVCKRLGNLTLRVGKPF